MICKGNREYGLNAFSNLSTCLEHVGYGIGITSFLLGLFRDNERLL